MNTLQCTATGTVAASQAPAVVQAPAAEATGTENQAVAQLLEGMGKSVTRQEDEDHEDLLEALEATIEDRGT
jgi:hypothetical protein